MKKPPPPPQQQHIEYRAQTATRSQRKNDKKSINIYNMYVRILEYR